MASLDPKTDFVDTYSVFSRVNTLDMCFFAKKSHSFWSSIASTASVEKKRIYNGVATLYYISKGGVQKIKMEI